MFWNLGCIAIWIFNIRTLSIAFKMHLGVNVSNALQQLESVKAAVDQSNDPKLKVSNSQFNHDINYVTLQFKYGGFWFKLSFSI